MSKIIPFDIWFDQIGVQYDDKEQASRAAWDFQQKEIDKLKQQLGQYSELSQNSQELENIDEP